MVATFHNCKSLCIFIALSAGHVLPTCDLCMKCDSVDMHELMGIKKRKKRSISEFIVDSGATIHCVNDISMFETMDEGHPPVYITIANGQKVKADAVGTVRVKLTDTTGEDEDVLLQNVVYSRHFSHNLLSVRRL